MGEVGFVGVGRMGRPMVDRLLAAGHHVTALARRPELRSELEDAGARVVATPREAAGQPVVLVCVFSDAQLREVSAGPDGLLAGLTRGAVLASHVTGLRDTVHALARDAAHVGAAVVDAPVSGTDRDIRAGRLTVLLGGEPAAVQAVAELASAYANTLLRTGPLGSALAVKLVNNLLFASNAQAAAAAVRLGVQLGVAPTLLLEALASSSGASYAAGVLAGVGGSIEAMEAAAGEFMRKDLTAVEEELRAVGADAGVLADVVARGPLRLQG